MHGAGRWAGPLPDPTSYDACPDRLRERQPLFDRTGGVHAAGLSDGRRRAPRRPRGRRPAQRRRQGDRRPGARRRRRPAEACLVRQRPGRLRARAEGRRRRHRRRSSRSARRPAWRSQLGRARPASPAAASPPRPARPCATDRTPRGVVAHGPVGGRDLVRPVRILHTSDWHLGRSFHRVGMLGAPGGVRRPPARGRRVRAASTSWSSPATSTTGRSRHVDAVAPRRRGARPAGRLPGPGRASPAATTTPPSGSASARG